MRPSDLSLGLIAVSLVVIVTEGFNAVYGYSLGRTEIECWGIATGCAAIGIVKVYMPFVVRRNWTGSRYLSVAVACAVLALCFAFGHFSQIGVMAERKLDRAAERGATADSKDIIRKQVAEAEAELAAIPIGRAPEVVSADLARAQRDYSIKWSNRAAREQALQVELAQAKDRAQKRAELDKQRSRLEGKVGLTADAQADALLAVYGWNKNGWKFLTILLPAWLLDIVSTFGAFLMRNPANEAGRLRVPRHLPLVPAAAPSQPAAEVPLTPRATPAPGYEFLKNRQIIPFKPREAGGGTPSAPPRQGGGTLQEQVLLLASRGKSQVAIATTLGIARSTVQKHLKKANGG